MIRNWERHSLYMDFSNLEFGYGRPSDIDMFFIAKNKKLIIGEIKNEKGELKQGQKRLFEQIIDNYYYGGTCLYIVHDKYVERGDRKVDISKCNVKEYYWNGRWIKPLQPINVKEAIDIISNI